MLHPNWHVFRPQKSRGGANAAVTKEHAACQLLQSFQEGQSSNPYDRGQIWDNSQGKGGGARNRGPFASQKWLAVPRIIPVRGRPMLHLLPCEDITSNKCVLSIIARDAAWNSIHHHPLRKNQIQTKSTWLNSHLASLKRACNLFFYERTWRKLYDITIKTQYKKEIRHYHDEIKIAKLDVPLKGRT